MMKLVLLSGLLLAVGCAKDESKSTAASGACSQEIVDAYNAVNRKAATLDVYSSDSDLREMSAACSRASSLMGSGSCKATNTRSGATQTVSYNDLRSQCDSASAKLRGDKPDQSAPKSPEVKPAPPKETSPKLNTFKKGFSLTVTNVEQMELFLLLADSAVIQGGRSTTKYSMDRTVPFCFLDGHGNNVKLTAGQVIEFTRVEHTSSRVIGITQDMKITVACANWDYSYWSVQDLNNVFMGLAQAQGMN